MEYHLGIDVTYDCNLKCKFCTHLSGYLGGHVPIEKIEKQYEVWSKKVAPITFGIVGGEPCLHPDLTELILLTRRYWPSTVECRLVSNGLLLHQCSTDVYAALRQTGTHVILSAHKSSTPPRWDETVHALNQYGIRYTIYDCWSRWYKPYRLEHCNISPYFSDPAVAWRSCMFGERCLMFQDNMLYRCPLLSMFTLGYQAGVLGEEWKCLLNYEPLSASANDEETLEWLNDACTRPHDLCGICAEELVLCSEAEKFPDTVKR